MTILTGKKMNYIVEILHISSECQTPCQKRNVAAPPSRRCCRAAKPSQVRADLFPSTMLMDNYA